MTNLRLVSPLHPYLGMLHLLRQSPSTELEIACKCIIGLGKVLTATHKNKMTQNCKHFVVVALSYNTKDGIRAFQNVKMYMFAKNEVPQF